MDFMAPVIAIFIGAAILAPGVIRFFKTQKGKAEGCGGCSGCSKAGVKRAAAPQIVQLKQK